MSTSAADPVSRPIDADTERHLREAALHPARRGEGEHRGDLGRCTAPLRCRERRPRRPRRRRCSRPSRTPITRWRPRQSSSGSEPPWGSSGAHARPDPRAIRAPSSSVRRSRARAHVSGFAFSTNGVRHGGVEAVQRTDEQQRRRRLGARHRIPQHQQMRAQGGQRGHGEDQGDDEIGVTTKAHRRGIDPESPVLEP